MNKQVWFDARGIKPSDSSLLSYVGNSGISTVVVGYESRKDYPLPSYINYVVELKNKEALEGINDHDTVMSTDMELLDRCREKGLKTCAALDVNDGESLEQSWKIGSKYDFVSIEFKSDTNIPLELVIARLQNTKTKLLKKVSSTLEAEIAFGVMEHGSDGVLFATDSMEEIKKMKELIGKISTQKFRIIEGTVKEIEHIGMGSRVCIDTTSLLKQNEGMIIGSTSSGGILVCSETHSMSYLNLRPFRVNAGAVHSYIWDYEGSTWYLTELKAGRKVMAVDNVGNAREVSVGRIKIEERPLLKIAVTANGEELNTIVQDEWHIRVLGIDGKAYNVSSLKAGDILAAYVCEPGRHVGIKITESIIEN